MSSFFEKAIDFLSMVQIAFFPIFIFFVIGVICYLCIDQPGGLILGIISLVVGVVLGVWYAIYIQKKRGATEFLSRVSATPELDKKEKK